MTDEPDDWCNDPSRGWFMDGSENEQFIYVSTFPHVDPPPRACSAVPTPTASLATSGAAE